MSDRYAVWDNDTTNTFYIQIVRSEKTANPLLLYVGKSYIHFKEEAHAKMLVDMLNALVDEKGIVEQRVHYWKIEAQTDHGRWLRCLEEIERLRASSFVTAVPSEEYDKVQAELTDLKAEADRLKAEVEHLTSENLLVREEADRYCRLWQEAKKGGQP
jgi:uncharacterized membrane protein YheB (UPF0754 family)